MPTRRRQGPLPRPRLWTAVVLALAACQAAPAAAQTLTLEMLNDSGVTGSVTFRGSGNRTEVEVRVDPAGNLDMPAHIHPGSCDNLTPQPKFPLENVRDGGSTTLVPAPVQELFAGNLALNIHRSNDDLGTYTACVDIK
jgi:hypothetical protein